MAHLPCSKLWAVCEGCSRGEGGCVEFSCDLTQQSHFGAQFSVNFAPQFSPLLGEAFGALLLSCHIPAEDLGARAPLGIADSRPS